MSLMYGKVAIVTGGAGDIGEAAAKALVSEGARVVLIDRDEVSLEYVRKKFIGDKVTTVVADIRKAGEVRAFVDHTMKTYGRIDVFFNNAGIIGQIDQIQNYSEEAFDEVIAVNLKGVWLCCKYALPRMGPGGSMVISSSVSGLRGARNLSGYVASKHGVVGIMKAMAIEFAHKRIRVNSVHPGPVEGKIMHFIEQQFSPEDVGKARLEREQRIPFGRYVTPEEVAKLVLWLLSDESSFITGTTQIIDGGLLS